jgi:ADP-ribosyl-[dinitrogen reductase] hydrolase
MLAGATYGLSALPKRWLDRLDRDVAQAIRDQVPRLLALAQRPAD